MPQFPCAMPVVEQTVNRADEAIEPFWQAPDPFKYGVVVLQPPGTGWTAQSGRWGRGIARNERSIHERVTRHSSRGIVCELSAGGY